MLDIRVHSVIIPVMLSLVHILGLKNVLVRLPVAVFVLAFCKSKPMSWSGCVLPMTLVRRHTFTLTFGCLKHTSLSTSSAFCLLSRVGRGDISALRCGLTGSCSSTFQYSSLGEHLDVTASSHSPLPAGYVTLPVNSRSPPLGLMLFHSKEQGN